MADPPLSFIAFGKVGTHPASPFVPEEPQEVGKNHQEDRSEDESPLDGSEIFYLERLRGGVPPLLTRRTSV
jgi:hypothetical protein